MKDSEIARQQQPGTGSRVAHIQRILSRFFVWASLLAWRSCVDWRTSRPVFTRSIAHISVFMLMLAALFLSGVEPAEYVLGAGGAQSPPQPEATLTPESVDTWQPASPSILSRAAVPHTTIPERPRVGVITYTVQPGDSVFGIANAFGLTPHTIYWANSDVLQDNPHLLRVDVVLNILPTDGVYHTVAEGETAESIAEEYGVPLHRLYNEWNNLARDASLTPGQQLVIPGGAREFVVWQLPTFSDLRGSAAHGSGVCALPATGLRGNGWFIWPTNSRRISGWVFRDARNPAHSGLDIGLRTGDPLYAADNGVVRYAGWSNAGYGYLIVLDHGNGYQTYYAHMSAIWVVCGQSVYQGTTIGAGGSTGWSTGPHLHFEIRYEGVPVNPSHYLP